MKTAANWVRYTPEIARTILDGHINIRVVNIPHVGYLAGEMAAGRWRANGETIKFAQNGDLVDGQHRLLAICRSGCTVEMLTVHGVTGEGVDEGRKRAFSDMIFGSEKSGNHEVAVIRVLYAMSNGSDPWTSIRARQLSNEELARFYGTLNSTWLDDSCRLGRAVRPVLASTITASVNYLVLAASGGAVSSESFFLAVREGVMLEDGSPEHSLRNWAESSMPVKGASQMRLARARFVAYVRAWNARCRGYGLNRQGLTTRINDTDLPTVEWVATGAVAKAARP